MSRSKRCFVRATHAASRGFDRLTSAISPTLSSPRFRANHVPMERFARRRRRRNRTRSVSVFVSFVVTKRVGSNAVAAKCPPRARMITHGRSRSTPPRTSRSAASAATRSTSRADESGAARHRQTPNLEPSSASTTIFAFESVVSFSFREILDDTRSSAARVRRERFVSGIVARVVESESSGAGDGAQVTQIVRSQHGFELRLRHGRTSVTQPPPVVSVEIAAVMLAHLARAAEPELAPRVHAPDARRARLDGKRILVDRAVASREMLARARSWTRTRPRRARAREPPARPSTACASPSPRSAPEDLTRDPGAERSALPRVGFLSRTSGVFRRREKERGQKNESARNLCVAGFDRGDFKVVP